MFLKVLLTVCSTTRKVPYSIILFYFRNLDTKGYKCYLNSWMKVLYKQEDHRS